jgi:hypothetical protein
MVIGGFYFLYITKIASKGFRKTIESRLRNVFEKENITIDLSQTPYSNFDKTKIQKLIEFYSDDAPETKTQNKWLLYIYLVIVIMLLFTVIMIVVLFRIYAPKSQVNIGRVIAENLVFFALVGCVEIMFFLNIGIKFIPSKPSLLIDTIMNSLLKNFS